MTGLTTAVHPSGWRRRALITYLRSCSGRSVPILDPFKLPDQELLDKARAVEENGGAWLILASTDCPAFTSRMAELVPAMTNAVSIPVILHFPPTPGHGLPVVQGAAGSLWPALLESHNPYFVWQSFLETVTRWSELMPVEVWPEPILCAALTVGADARTSELLGTTELAEGREDLLATGALIRRLGLDMVYLYSRHERVAPQTCTVLRERLASDQLIFVSGNVRTADDVQRYLDAGADFVGFAGAFEVSEWRLPLRDLLSVSR